MKKSVVLYGNDENNSYLSNTSLDRKLARKIDCNQKAFTSQIDIIPGPKDNLIKRAGEDYKKQADGTKKRADEKNKLKNKQFYGALYQ